MGAPKKERLHAILSWLPIAETAPRDQDSNFNVFSTDRADDSRSPVNRCEQLFVAVVEGVSCNVSVVISLHHSKSHALLITKVGEL